MTYLKKIVKIKEQIKSNANGKTKIKRRAEINEIENRHLKKN